MPWEMQSQSVSLLQKILSGNIKLGLIFRNGYAEFKEIKTKTITVQGKKGDSKKAKLFITLSKSKDFDKKMEEFNEIRKKNDELKANMQESK